MIHPQIRRGDVFLKVLDTKKGSVQSGLRPVIVLQNDKQNKRSPTTIIAPLTSKTGKKRFMAAHIAVGTEFGLLKDSQILIEQLQTVSTASLGPYIGHVDDEQILKAIDIGLCKTLGIRNYPIKSESSEQEVSL